MLQFINLDPKENWFGRLVGQSKECYDIINDYLFKAMLAHFMDFKDDMKGFVFEPNLRYQKWQELEEQWVVPRIIKPLLLFQSNLHFGYYTLPCFIDSPGCNSN